MAYKITVSPRAQMEIEEAVEYYAQNSVDASLKFLAVITDTYKSLEINPFFRIRYKNIRALQHIGFPYTLYFVISESQQAIKILACFQSQQDPSKTPKD